MAESIRTQDIMSVGTRVSWAAVLAGAAIAITVFVFMSILGVALGLTISHDVDEENLALGAAVWSIVSLLVSLFLGGYVVSLSTAGETKGEALMYGVLLWATLFVVLTVLSAAGVSLGLAGMMNDVNLSRGQPTVSPTERAERLREAGFTDRQIKVFSDLGDRTRHVSPTTTAWWTVGGMFLALIASLLGAVTGAGPTLVLRSLGFPGTPVLTTKSMADAVETHR
jgi:hypothetical protein